MAGEPGTHCAGLADDACGLLRSAVLSAKEQDYVDAARALGANDFRIIVRHILPNAIAPVIVYATITVGVIISAEAALVVPGGWTAIARHLVGFDDRRLTDPDSPISPTCCSSRGRSSA